MKNIPVDGLIKFIRFYPGGPTSNDIKIKMETDAVSIADVCEVFKMFLAGCGFSEKLISEAFNEESND